VKRKLIVLSGRYQAALQKHLKQGPLANLRAARGLGRRAVALGLEPLDMARIHEGALAILGSAALDGDGVAQRAEFFFAEAITPIENTHHAALHAGRRLGRLNQTLVRRTTDLAASQRSLKQGVAQRKAVEQALSKSAGHHARLLKESRRLLNHLRHLTRRILSAQEVERKKLSRALHDEVAQTLLGINVRLLTLKKEAALNQKTLKKEIATTQRLVRKSSLTMNRFAHEFGKRYES
jgi:signal transduction histidine kinase